MPQHFGTSLAASNRLVFMWEISLDDNLIIGVLWFVQHPFGAATVVFATSIVGVLVYTYFEPRDLR